MTVYKCNLCEKSFSHELIRDEHVSISHNNYAIINYEPNMQSYIKIEQIEDFTKQELLGLEEQNETVCDKYIDDSKKVFECNFCNEIFYTSVEYIAHMKNHLQFQLFICHLCENSFNTELEYKSHLCFNKTIEDETKLNTLLKNYGYDLQNIVVYDNKPNLILQDDNSTDCQKCELCNKLFNDINDYILHINKCSRSDNKDATNQKTCEIKHEISSVESEHEILSNIKNNTYVLSFNNLYKFEVYDEPEIGKNKELWQTVDVSKNKMPASTLLNCKICEKTFPDVDHLKSHMVVHYDIYQHKCNKCDMLFQKLSDYNKHMLIHNNERLYHCNICNKSFTHLSSKEKHMLIHSDIVNSELSTICDLCEESFINIEDLKIHIHEHTGEPIKCNMCEEIMTNSFQYKNHMETHVTEDYYICNICGKKLTSITAFNKHNEKHLNENDTCCSVCGKTFRTNHNLKIHMRIHTLSRPYVCNICGKSFTQTSSHTIHMRTHTGERPYKCNICGKTFSQTGHHKTHMRIHSGLRPFKCICSKSFSDYGNYIKHKRLHTGEQPFKCLDCNKGFGRKKRFDMHMMLHEKLLEN